MTIKICVSVAPRTVGEALELVGDAESQRADFVEVRLDSLDAHDRLADIAYCSNTPLIAANRSVECKGEFLGNEARREEILIDAAREGFEYVDIEVSVPRLSYVTSALREIGAKVIGSFHDFNGTPDSLDLRKILEKEVAGGVDVCKIVTTATLVRDNLTVLEFVSKASESVRTICFAMGELGRISRLLSPVFGAFFTFASLTSDRITADGQYTIGEMRNAYNVLELK